MTYKELKEKLETLTEDQLNQTTVVFNNDEEIGNEIDGWEESEEDFYWMDGDCYGDLKTTNEQIVDINKTEPEDDPITIEDFTKIPKGTFTLHTLDPKFI